MEIRMKTRIKKIIEKNDSVDAKIIEEVFTEGCAEGYRDGCVDGYDNGIHVGYDKGHKEGYDNGYDNGIHASYDRGYNDGHEDGYEKGYLLIKNPVDSAIKKLKVLYKNTLK